MKRGKILVTPRSLSKAGHSQLDRLVAAGYEVLRPFPGRQPTEDELLEVLPDCVGYLAGVERIGARVLDRCPVLKIISRNGVGIDNIDPEAAERQGVAVTITAGANSRGVAELAIAMILSSFRSIPETHRSVKSGAWERTKGMEAYGRTLGVVGTGQVGRQVAKMGVGLDMRIMGYDPYPAAEIEEYIPGFRYAALEELFAESDVVSLHCPAGEKALIDGESLNRFKEGSFLVNTARSALVDQDAVLKALESGRLAGYAVDAFDSEPPEMTPLFAHPKVIMTAHIGGFTEESVERATSGAVDNLLQILRTK